MIVIRVELWNAVTGKMTELARMHICNRGDHPNARMGNYDAMTLRGRSQKALDRCEVSRCVEIINWPREQRHVWNLVAKASFKMDYGS